MSIPEIARKLSRQSIEQFQFFCEFLYWLNWGGPGVQQNPAWGKHNLLEPRKVIGRPRTVSKENSQSCPDPIYEQAQIRLEFGQIVDDDS